MTELVVDAGISAKSLKRPGLQRVLSLLGQREADGIVILKIDRLTRSVRDWQHLFDGYFCEKAGKKLISVLDTIDTRTAAGRMFLNLQLVVSQWEREVIGERTKEAAAHKRKKGELWGGVPYGYVLESDGKTLRSAYWEQQCIQWMKERHEEGKTYRWMAKQLNASSYFATKSGRPWNHNSVYAILKRERRRELASA